MKKIIMGFTESEYDLFCKTLKPCSSYFEFGSGNSTILADSNKNISTAGSVDSCMFWINDVSSKIKTDKVNFVYIDINAGKAYGYPTDKSKIKNWPSYSQAVLGGFDLYFVDGRFRVACCLKIWEKCLITQGF